MREWLNSISYIQLYSKVDIYTIDRINGILECWDTGDLNIHFSNYASLTHFIRWARCARFESSGRSIM